MQDHDRRAGSVEHLALGRSRVSAWYFGGDGPLVNGAALRQRLARTAVMIAIVLVSLIACALLGGPSWSLADLQGHMDAAWAEPDHASALLRFAGAMFMQVIATVLAFKVLANVIGLTIAVPRYARWLRLKHSGETHRAG